MAFNTPVQAANGQFAAAPSSQADPAALSALNATLASIGATRVDRLFTNLPAAELQAARAQAEAAEGKTLTDFTQIYQVTYNPAINAGTAANDIAKSKLVSSAMPDWIFTKPTDPNKLTRAQRKTAQAALTKARVADKGATAPAPVSNAASLPKNAAYISDAQSYQDAASNDVTGAATMLGKKFSQTPGQGQVVTNISLGNVDNNSTVLQNGQRYIVQAGYPKIPVWLSNSACTPDGAGGQNCTVVAGPDGDDGRRSGRLPRGQPRFQRHVAAAARRSADRQPRAARQRAAAR